MLDVKIYTKVDNVKATIRIEFIEELNYPLMYVENIRRLKVSIFLLNLLTILLNDFFNMIHQYNTNCNRTFCNRNFPT